MHCGNHNWTNGTHVFRVLSVFNVLNLLPLTGTGATTCLIPIGSFAGIYWEHVTDSLVPYHRLSAGTLE